MTKLPDPTSVRGRLAHLLDRCLRERHWKRTAFARGHVHANTVRHVLQGKDSRLSTLIALADALDCELVVEFKPKEPNAHHSVNDLS